MGRTLHLTHDELYEFVKLYDILRDMDFELTPKQVDVLDRLQEMETGYDAEDVEQCIVETNGDYSECVDRMVETMKSPVELENVTDEWYDKEGNLIP